MRPDDFGEGSTPGGFPGGRGVQFLRIRAETTPLNQHNTPLGQLNRASHFQLAFPLSRGGIKKAISAKYEVGFLWLSTELVFN